MKCKQCKKEFEAKRSDAKFCSAGCRQKHYRKRDNLRKRNALALQLEPEKIAIKNPPVRYYGGKWRLAKWIIEQFPSRHTCYVEPFCGGASVLFQKEPSTIEVINDLNSNIVTFFDVLRSRPEELIRALQLTPFSREEHRRAYQPFSAEDYPDYQLEQARRFYVRSRQSFGSGEGQYSTGWRYQSNNNRGQTLTDEWNNLNHLWAVAERLKAVQIENDNALKVMDRFDSSETLFYVDPPYMFETRYSDEKRYAYEMSDDEHIALAEKVKSLAGMVLLSAYPSELYDELYARDGWRCFRREANTNGNNRKVECLWVSPKAYQNQLPMFNAV